MTAPKLNNQYRQFTFKNDPKTMLQLPLDVMSDIKKMADFNKRSIREEITSRLIATLKNNDDLMQKDHLHQLIFNAKLAVDPKAISTKNKNNKKK